MSRTAVGVARIRAAESGRTDRLFDDPYAAAFVTAAGGYDEPRPSPSPQQLALVFHVIIRTRYFDDYLLDATAQGIRQVVLVAAGLDARAFRLDWPAGTRLYELDLPDLLAVKEQVLRDAPASARCDRSVVAVDLRADWLEQLRAAGWDSAQPTAWLAEGLLVYLEAAEAAHVLDEISRGSAQGSRLALERPARTHDLAAADTAAVTGLWKGGLDGPPEQALRDRGWSVQVDNLAEVAASYGRPMSRATESGFITAHLA